MSSHWGGSPTNLILAFSHISPRYFCRGPLRGARPIILDPPTQPRVSSRNVVCGKNRAEKGRRQRHKPRPRHSQLARETRKNGAQASPREGGTIYIAGKNVRGMRSDDKLEEIADCFERRGVWAMALQETWRWSKQGGSTTSRKIRTT